MFTLYVCNRTSRYWIEYFVILSTEISFYAYLEPLVLDAVGAEMAAAVVETAPLVARMDLQHNNRIIIREKYFEPYNKHWIIIGIFTACVFTKF
jgi:hypothetical protein